jgi:NADH-quinone oxidoreductase subunit J
MAPDAAIVVTASVAEQAVFWLLSAFTVFFALFTMTRRNPVTAVMSLVATFFGLAAIYATLSAHFLAVVQVLVYAGAIMVLFIFVVMILNREEVRPFSMGLTRIVGVGAGIYVFLMFRSVAHLGLPAGPAAPLPESFGTVASIGDMLFRQFLFPFEAISLLLLVAIVGGVVISRSHQKEVNAERAAAERNQFAEMASHDFPEAEALPAESPGGGHH